MYLYRIIDLVDAQVHNLKLRKEGTGGWVLVQRRETAGIDIIASKIKLNTRLASAWQRNLSSCQEKWREAAAILVYVNPKSCRPFDLSRLSIE